MYDDSEQMSQLTNVSNSEHVKPNNNSKKSHYKKDKNLPNGWTYYVGSKNTTYFRNETGKFFTSRRKAIAFMFEKGGFSKEEIFYIRDGLLDEGWRYHLDLPPGWMYKKYTHKIEGLDTDILYLLSHNGAIYRSKIKIQRCAIELNLTAEDLQQLMEFKVEESDDHKKVDNPEEWIHVKDCVPDGWKMKKYSYNSKVTNKVEHVFHYLTPDNYVLRGKKQVQDYMEKTGTFNHEDFDKFHFSKLIRRKTQKVWEKTITSSWSDWSLSTDLAPGWMSRFCNQKGQRKVQYKSPSNQKFLSRLLASRSITSGPTNREVDLSEAYNAQQIQNKSKPTSSQKQVTVWDEWRNDEIPCLLGWQFGIGRKGKQRRIRYMSPSGEVFKSRGPLIRYLHDNNLKSKAQLVTLKKLLKINQGKHFSELKENDKFIKNFNVDLNYLQFLKIRYESESHDNILEVIDPKLPKGWKKKNINGVDYFKDPTGKFVYNSRQLVVDHLKRYCCELSDDQLLLILEDSDSESDLSGEEFADSSDEDNLDHRSNLVVNHVEILGI